MGSSLQSNCMGLTMKVDVGTRGHAHDKISAGLDDALAFMRGDNERGQIVNPVYVLGVDPGIQGGIAFYCGAGILAEEIPVAANRVDITTLMQRIEQMRPALAMIEDVWAMPKQGVSSSFRFGEAFGSIKGVITALKIPMHLAPATAWKKFYKLDSDKEKSRALALRYWPESKCFSRKKDHGRAEAALIARYGYEKLVARAEREVANA